MRAEHVLLVFVVFVSCVASYEVYTDSDGVYYYQQHPSEPVRDKRTLGVFLKSFADALGYDVQKRPSVLPLAPAVAAPAAPPPPPAPAPAPKAPAAPPAAPVAPAVPVPGPKAPVAPPMPAPAAPAPKAPAMPAPAPPAPKAPAPAPAPAAPAPPPAPPAPKSPIAPLPRPGQARPPTAPPLLTETIQKMFNINFNWNRNVQPSAAAPAGPAPKPGAAPAAPPAAPPARPAPKAPAAPPAAPPPPAPAPAPKMPAPAPQPAPVPQNPITPPTKAPPKKYEDYPQENVDYLDPQQIIYYPDYQESANQQQEINQVQDYDFPKVINAYWQNSPWNKNNVQVNNAPDYQEYVGPDGERGYHVRHYQQNSHLQQQNAPEEQQQVEQSPENVEQQEQPQNQQYQQQEDGNPQSSKEFFQYQPNSQPRGFQPVYHGSESRFQTGYYRPGLPLSVHGIHEDKVLVAWPSPFESAESEIKKKIAAQDRYQAAGSEQQEYNYKPDSYEGFSFYEVPEPSSQYNNYKPPADPKIEEELSPNAKVSEQNYGKKYTNVRIDRNTRRH